MEARGAGMLPRVLSGEVDGTGSIVVIARERVAVARRGAVSDP